MVVARLQRTAKPTWPPFLQEPYEEGSGPRRPSLEGPSEAWPGSGSAVGMVIVKSRINDGLRPVQPIRGQCTRFDTISRRNPSLHAASCSMIQIYIGPSLRIRYWRCSMDHGSIPLYVCSACAFCLRFLCCFSCSLNRSFPVNSL